MQPGEKRVEMFLGASEQFGVGLWMDRRHARGYLIDVHVGHEDTHRFIQIELRLSRLSIHLGFSHDGAGARRDRGEAQLRAARGRYDLILAQRFVERESGGDIFQVGLRLMKWTPPTT